MIAASCARLETLISGECDIEYSERLAAHRTSAFAELWPARMTALRSWRQDDIAPLEARIAALPLEGQQRLAEAPEMWTFVCGALPSDVGDEIEILSSWVDAEECRYDPTRIPARTCWTALGDLCVMPRGVPPARLAAPVLAERIVLDWQSPTATGSLAEIKGQAGPLWAEHGARACKQVEGAYGFITRGSPQWASLICRFVRVIAIRRDAAGARFDSATTRLAIGRPVLRNAHASDATVLKIAEALIHETVHTLVDCYELDSPFLRRRTPRADALLQSPWTGKLLDPGTFAHACLVWAALVHFWISCLRNGAITEALVLDFLGTSASGFLASPSPLRRILSQRAVFNDGVVELVEAAEQRVRRALAV